MAKGLCIEGLYDDVVERIEKAQCNDVPATRVVSACHRPTAFVRLAAGGFLVNASRAEDDIARHRYDRYEYGPNKGKLIHPDRASLDEDAVDPNLPTLKMPVFFEGLVVVTFYAAPEGTSRTEEEVLDVSVCLAEHYLLGRRESGFMAGHFVPDGQSRDDVRPAPMFFMKKAKLFITGKRTETVAHLLHCYDRAA